MHALLLSGRTSKIREVYYYYVNWFKTQAEANTAILEASSILGVDRASLGLFASPKGWFVGKITVERMDPNTGEVVARTICDELGGVGAPITSEWLSFGNGNGKGEEIIDDSDSESDSESDSSNSN